MSEQSRRMLMEDLGALLNQATGTDEVEASPRYQLNLCLALNRALPRLQDDALLVILQSYVELSLERTHAWAMREVVA